MAKREPLTVKDIRIGATYRGKTRRSNDWGQSNDRTVLYISPLGEVQYDSDMLPNGRRYPRVTMDKFLRWAAAEVPASGNGG